MCFEVLKESKLDPSASFKLEGRYYYEQRASLLGARTLRTGLLASLLGAFLLLETRTLLGAFKVSPLR